ncbi:UBN2_3 domain-containing protein [Fagus crenata]
MAEISNPTNDSTMPNPDLVAWTCTDRLVKAWITATISEEALGTVVGLTASLDVWKALSNAYSQDSQLNAIGKSVPDQKKVFWLLNGLGPRYESFSTAMLKPPVPSYNDLIPLLHSHELRNRSLLADQVNPAMAFVGQRSNSNNKGSQSSFNSRGRGFHQAGSRPPSTPRNFQQHAPSKNSNHSSTPTSSAASTKSDSASNLLAEWVPSKLQITSPPTPTTPIPSPPPSHTLDKEFARLFSSEHPLPVSPTHTTSSPLQMTPLAIPPSNETPPPPQL